MTPDDIGPFLARTTPRLLVVVFTAMALLFVSTGFLTRAYRRERRLRAEQQYQVGQAMMQQGRYNSAIDMFTEALTLNRDEDTYLQSLALALVEAGRTNEAETYLQQLIRTDPANGLANLMLARIYLGEGDSERATQHYQRAIYGLWTSDPAARRLEARFELVDLLEKRGRYREMEAELLRLLDEAPDDPELKKRIGRLFLSARSYDNAAKVFEEVTEALPRDAEAYAGLGDAEFELGHYYSARTAYRRAFTYNPDDLQSHSQFDLATEIIDLNPMARGLGSTVRLDRSRTLVKRAIAALGYCLPEDHSQLPEAFQETLGAAEQVVASKTKQRAADAVEENIELAEELEDYRQLNCGAPPVPDVALTRVIKQLAN